MKKLYAYLAATAMTAATAWAAPAEQVLFEEDFAGFAAGSEAEPVLITVNDYYELPEGLTAQEGWTANGAYQMGGVCGLLDRPGADPEDGPEYQFGTISTPKNMLFGTATLTFRAKKLTGEETELWVAMCDDYYGPGSDQTDITLTDEWTEYTLVATEGSDYDPSYFQFVAMGGHVALDDVKLTFRRDKIAAPSAYPAVNNSLTEFTAVWEGEAPTYKLNVYKLADAADGVSGTQTSTPEKTLFSATGDSYTTAATEADIQQITLHVTPSAWEDDYESLSLLAVYIYYPETDYWDWVANVPYYYIDPSTSTYTIGAEGLNRGARQVKVEMIQKGQIDFEISAIDVDYATAQEVVPVVADLETSETSYTVKDIDPEADHFYYVTAIDGDIVSERSNEVWVDGLTGLKVGLEEPTDVTPTSFTARWQRMPKADSYSVECLRSTTAAADMAQVVVIEENFDAITDGTVDNPGYDWMSPYDYGANGLAATSWLSTNPCWAAGMAGTQGTSWTGQAGLVLSPVLDLSCNANQGFDVEFTTYVSVAEMTIEGDKYAEGVFAMVLNSENDSQALASAFLPTPEVGFHSGKLHVETPADLDLKAVHVAFMNITGTKFFIDNVKITQDLKAGETLVRPLKNVTADTNEFTFTDLAEDSDHAYAVTAHRTREYQNYRTDRSDVQTVATSQSGIEAPEAPAVTLRGEQGRIVASQATPMTVFNAAGEQIFISQTPVSEVAAAPGLYLVSTPCGAFKVLVR